MVLSDFGTGNVDCSNVLGLSYIAVRHPLGVGVDIVQSETGQTVQNISLSGVREASWSCNSSHLALVVHLRDSGARDNDSTNKRMNRNSNQAQLSSRSSDPEGGSTLEKYEIRVYSCSDSSTNVPPQWLLWKTIPAPLYSLDFKSVFAYSHMSFSFPLITLSVQQSGREDRSSGGTKVVLLDVNVCVFDEVLLFLPDSEGDTSSSLGLGSRSTSSHGVSREEGHRVVALSPARLSATGGFLALSVCFIDTDNEDLYQRWKKDKVANVEREERDEVNHGKFSEIKLQEYAAIPVLCVVDVFLSSHFLPFRGHFFAPTPQELAKKEESDGKGDKKEGEGSEDCIAFHSVFSDESEGEMDRAGDFPRRHRGTLPTGRSGAPISVKQSGTSSKNERKASSPDMAAYLVGSDAEGSSPTYIDLRTNTAITGASCNDYMVELRAGRGNLDEAVGVDVRTHSALRDLSWRTSHTSNLDNREMLLTVDQGGAIKVWSARRRELSIPVTTAARSISGAGTSCIVSGNFHTHVNPDVSLLLERGVQGLVEGDGVLSDANTNNASGGMHGTIRVSWVDHQTCPVSEQKHLSRQYRTAHIREFFLLGKGRSGDGSHSTHKKADSERVNGSAGQGNYSAHDVANSDLNSVGTFNDGSASGVWLSVLAPYRRLGDCCYTDDDSASEQRGGRHNGLDHSEHPEYLQYHFVCLNTHPLSHQTQAVVWGKGPIVPLGAALFPPSVSQIPNKVIADCFSDVLQSFVVGRFASSGLGYPFSVDTLTVLRDAPQGGRKGGLNCLIKAVSGISQRVGSPKSCAKNAPKISAHRAGKVDGRDGAEDARTGFTVFPTGAYDLLYGDAHAEDRSEVVSGSGGDSYMIIEGGERSHGALGPSEETQRVSLRSALPFSADSLAGPFQASLSAFDSHGQVFRVSPSPGDCPSSAKNIQVLSRLGLSELQQAQSLQSEAVSYEILPALLEPVGLADVTSVSRSCAGSSSDVDTSTGGRAGDEGANCRSGDDGYSLLRAIVVPLGALSAVEGSGSSHRARDAEQLLLVLQHSERHGLRLVMWTHSHSKHSTQHKNEGEEDRDDDPAPSRSGSSPSLLLLAPDTSLARLSLDTSSEQVDPAYIVEITPDPLFGLGLRLDVRDSAIVVDSFKRHPVTDGPLACEACLLIRPQDELVAIDHHNLEGASLSTVIQTIRQVVQDSKGKPVSLTLERPPLSFSAPTSPKDRANSSIGINSRKEVEKNLIASANYFWQFYDVIRWPSDPPGPGVGGSDLADTISGDIGYDSSTGMVIVSTLSGGRSGGRRELKLLRVTSISDITDNGRDMGASTCCALLSRHLLSRPSSSSSPTVQLWRDRAPSPAHRTVYVSIVSQTHPSSAQGWSSDTADTDTAGLQPCCSIVTVRMPYRGACSSSDVVGRSLCEESSVSVVSSALPPSPPTSSQSPPVGASAGSNNTALFNAKFGRHSDTSQSGGTAIGPDSGEGSSAYGGSRFQLLTSPMISEGCKLSRRILLSDPMRAVVLSASLWGGAGYLNTPRIEDISRHPFTLTGGSLPVLALCTQLLDMKTAPSGAASDCRGDAVICCALSSDLDTIQITSRNSAVHVFRHLGDLQAIIHDEANRIAVLQATGSLRSMGKALVGFGVGKGGRWVRVGFASSGCSNRGGSPLSMTCIPWEGEETRYPPSSLSTHSSSDTNVKDREDWGSLKHPISAALSLFQSLSCVPDIPLPPSSAAVKPVKSAEVTKAFGFGFGMMSSMRSTAGDDSQQGGSTIGDKGQSKESSAENSAFPSALTVRFNSIFAFCDGVVGLLAPPVSPQEGQAGSKAMAQMALNSIDGEEEGVGATDGNMIMVLDDDGISEKGDDEMSMMRDKLSSLSSLLLPSASSLLTAATAEQAAFVFQSLALFLPPNQLAGVIEAGEDIVLTYVIAELMSRLCVWAGDGRADGVSVVDEVPSSSSESQYGRISSRIAGKLSFLTLDESGVNAVLGALCESILRGVQPNRERRQGGAGEGKSANGFVDDLLKKEDEGGEKASSKEGASSDNSAPPSDFHMGGTCAANCLVSESQSVLYELFVLSALDNRLLDSSGSESNGYGYQPPSMDAESLKGRKRADTLSLASMIAPSPPGREGDSFDVFSYFAATQCCLWLVDVTPLGDLIGRHALQRFKDTKDSMDIFLEMVVAGQTDKLFLLAKADRNNTGKQLLALLAHDLTTESAKNILRKNAFALMRLRRYKHAAAAFLCSSPPMVKEACSILCKQCEDPLLGLLVARIVESQSLSKYGHSGRKGGYLLGPVARSIVTNYMLPGFLSGVELDGHAGLSSRYSEVYNSKAMAVIAAPSRGGKIEGGKVKGDSFLDDNKSYQYRKEKLKLSFGTSGVDAAVLSMVSAVWLQCSRAVDSTFQHCCAQGLFSSALGAQSPLLPAHVYETMEGYFNLSASSSVGFGSRTALPHHLSSPAGHAIEERARNVLSTASLVRWLLVSTSDPGPGSGGCREGSAFGEYRNRNLSLNSRRVCTVLTALETFLAEALCGTKDFAALRMGNVRLKKGILEAFQRKRLAGRCQGEADGADEKLENSFKKACRSAFLSWQRDVQRIKSAQQEELRPMSFSGLDRPVSTSKAPTASALDIFDMPYTRKATAGSSASTPLPAPPTLPPAPSTVPPPESGSAYGEDDDVAQAMRRLNKLTAGSREGAGIIASTSTAESPAPLGADGGDVTEGKASLFGGMGSRGCSSSGGGASALDMFDPPSRPRPRPAPSTAPPDFDIFDMPPPPRRPRAPPVPPADADGSK